MLHTRLRALTIPAGRFQELNSSEDYHIAVAEGEVLLS
jgi:hypothetical protein